MQVQPNAGFTSITGRRILIKKGLPFIPPAGPRTMLVLEIVQALEILTAHTLYSGILAMGSMAVMVSLLTAASL